MAKTEKGHGNGVKSPEDLNKTSKNGSGRAKNGILEKLRCRKIEK